MDVCFFAVMFADEMIMYLNPVSDESEILKGIAW